MSPKAKKVNVSSIKSMDITTSEKDNMPTIKTTAPEIIKPTGMIKDISPSQVAEADSRDNLAKIEMSEKLASNLKPPSESHVKIIPSAPVTEDDEKATPDADDLTNDDEGQRDSSFIDEISDEKDAVDSKETKDVEKPEVSEKVDEKTSVPEEKSKDLDKESQKPEDTKVEDKSKDESIDDQQGIVNEMAEQAADTKKQKQEEKELETRSKHVEELIKSKTYNVPIAQLSHKRNARLLLIVLVLLVVGGIVALNFAIDAGVVDIGVDPLTDVISN